MRALVAGRKTGLLAALVCIGLASPALAASVSADAWITTKVKLSLATTAGVSAGEVNVDTIGRQVTLHGTVNTAAEKETAERTARAVGDVLKVRNLLQVVPAKNEKAVEEKDEEINGLVSAALASESSLKDSAITVQSVNKGVVLLAGNARTLSDHLTAVELAGDVRGVRRVASEVQSPDTLANADVWMERNIPVSGSEAHSARSAANDLYITSVVKTRLLADAEVPALEINVDTRDGVVTLFGIVANSQSKAAAESDAMKAGGVASVKNQLQVVSSARQPAVEAKDDVVESEVKRNLEQRAAFGAVGTEVRNCVVRLTGTVPSGIERVEAMQVARATRGVCSVNADLTIR